MKKTAIIILLLSSVFADAQKVNLFQHFDGESLSLRWQINDNESWANSLQTGFLLTKTNTRTGEKTRYEIKNTTAEYLRIGNVEENIATSLATLLDSETDHRFYLEEQFEGADLNLDDIDYARRKLVDYVLNTEYDLILKSGFGFKDEKINRTDEYLYQLTNLRPVVSAENKIDYEFRFSASSYIEPSLPEITPNWEDKRVVLKWNTRVNNQVYFGYEVHQSINEGEFIILDTLIINPQDTSSQEALHYMYDRILLDNNDSTYTFRVYGKDYLGLRSEKYAEVTGKGSIGIGASPSIDQSELLNSNEVDLRWSIYPQFRPNVTEWRIYVGEKWDGPYEIDSVGIDPETNQLIRPLPYENNFFRVVATDINGIEHSSFPTLVTHLDTTPPAIPTNLEAKIDTNGVVDLTWDQNYEKDFYGYKLFFGFDTTSEMTLANFKAFPESNFTDTIGLKSTNRDLYYKVTAVDNRNNRSPFSKIVKLLKPDILAPVAPNFYNYKSRPAGVFLAWHPSSSGDVTVQQLFRRNIDTETEWTMIKEWEIPDIDSIYTDSALLPKSSYAYFVMAMDSSGNYSNPSRPAVVKTLPKHDLDLDLWQITKLDNTEVEISHQFDDTEIHSIHLFKKQADKAPFELAILDVNRRRFGDDAIKKNVRYSYFIKVIYLDGYETEYSEPKSIIYE